MVSHTSYSPVEAANAAIHRHDEVAEKRRLMNLRNPINLRDIIGSEKETKEKEERRQIDVHKKG